MFLRKRGNDTTKKRHVVVYIKTSNSFNFNAEAGDRILQIACVEMLNGDLTGKTFSSFVNPNNAGLLKQCAAHYHDNLDKKAADELTSNITHAPQFKDIQPALLAFLGDPANTKLIVHVVKHVKDFLRNELDEEGVKLFNQFIVENMISKAAKLAKTGQYNGGKFPDQIDTNREKLPNTRAFYDFNNLCAEFKISTRLRSGYSAVEDADMLARVERNRLNLIRPDKKQTVDDGPALRK